MSEGILGQGGKGEEGKKGRRFKKRGIEGLLCWRGQNAERGRDLRHLYVSLLEQQRVMAGDVNLQFQMKQTTIL